MSELNAGQREVRRSFEARRRVGADAETERWNEWFRQSFSNHMQLHTEGINDGVDEAMRDFINVKNDEFKNRSLQAARNDGEDLCQRDDGCRFRLDEPNAR
jgi:hypothetical protein